MQSGPEATAPISRFHVIVCKGKLCDSAQVTTLGTPRPSSGDSPRRPATAAGALDWVAAAQEGEATARSHLNGVRAAILGELPCTSYVSNLLKHGFGIRVILAS